MRSLVACQWPLLAGAGLLLVVTGLLFVTTTARTGGRFVYPLDDPYIHMAMAKNLSLHGVWGVTRHGFTSASSSPLWTLLLALVYLVVGPSEIAPLLLCLVCGLLLLVVTDRLIREHGLESWARAATLCGLVLLVPLPAVLFTGQEHVLQATLSLAFVWTTAAVINRERPLWLLAVLALLLTATRYEGLFLVFLAMLLLYGRRRYGAGVGVAVAGLLPVAAYGVVSMLKGWFFLPNAVLMKAAVSHQAVRLVRSGFGTTEFRKAFADIVGLWGLKQIVTTPHVFAAVLLVLLLLVLRLRQKRRFWEFDTVLGSIFLAASFLHMHFARPGPLHRYEAYLVAVGVVAVATLMHNLRPGCGRAWFRATGVAAGLAAAVMIWVGGTVTAHVPQASRNIFEQQYQMGLFLRRFYQGQTIAANDIGAINWLADIKCFDIWGLGTMRVARLKAHGNLSPEALGATAESTGVRIAIIYEDWLKLTQTKAVPAHWTKVGSWHLRDNLVCGCDSVAFFACRPEERARLKECLGLFARHLPRMVIQTGEYVSEQ
jgi:hypothetical protein